MTVLFHCWYRLEKETNLTTSSCRLRAPASNRRAESAERVSAQPGLNGHTTGTAVTFRISLVEQDGKSIVGSMLVPTSLQLMDESGNND